MPRCKYKFWLAWLLIKVSVNFTRAYFEKEKPRGLPRIAYLLPHTWSAKSSSSQKTEVLRVFYASWGALEQRWKSHLQYVGLAVQVGTSQVPPVEMSETVPSHGSNCRCKGTCFFLLLSLRLTPELTPMYAPELEVLPCSSAQQTGTVAVGALSPHLDFRFCEDPLMEKLKMMLKALHQEIPRSCDLLMNSPWTR